jgi:hypothetical protein
MATGWGRSTWGDDKWGVTSAIFAVTGVAGTSALGNAINVWGLVNTSQTPDWNTVSDTQTPDWSTVSDTQTPNWQEVA